MEEKNKKEFFTCRYDATFKEVFMKEENKDILIALIESILDIKIKDLKYLNLEKNNGNIFVRRKHFDFHIKTEKENIHIEVNNYLEDYVRPRNMAFICNTYSREVLRGEEYDECTEFIQINLTYKMINEYKYKIYVFAISAFIAGTVGAFFAHYLSSISTASLGLEPFLLCLVMVVMGGMGKYPGAAIGAFVVKILDEALRPTLTFRLVILGLIIIIVMTYLPHGIMGLLEELKKRISHARIKKEGA